MDFLVTGGAGFIGSNAVRRLVETGHRVRVLDNLVTGRRENLADVMGAIDFLEGDIRDAATVRRACDGVRHVLHIAALPSVQRSVEDPMTTNEVNVGGTLNMLLAAREAKVRRFVFSSSSSVYGQAPGFPRREDAVPAPVSPYAAQKLVGEYYCRVFHRLYGVPTFVLRYFNVFGPRQDPNSSYAAVVPRFLAAAAAGRPLTVFGDGNQTRDFTFVEDVVAANLRCCEAPDRAAGCVLNVARGRRVSVNEVATAIMNILGRRVPVRHEPARPGEVRDSEGDSSRAQETIGWQPAVSFEEGLRRTISFFAEATGSGTPAVAAGKGAMP